MTLRIASDIGGTFTDTVLMAADGTVLTSAKTLTTHTRPGDGALTGAKRVLGDVGRDMSDLTGFVHGTTLATNALIEKRGAKVATITTQGFRDILEIAYERRYDQYDLSLTKPDRLVEKGCAFTVPERVDVAGRVLLQLDESVIPQLIASIEQSGAKTVAICLLHSYANPKHERRLRDLIAQMRPGLTISISSDVSPEAREFDRLSTTVANAYIQPLMESYIEDLKAQFRNAGLLCPVLMMTAGGGMTTLETAARLPIRLVESGPAGGALLAARIAARHDLSQVLSFDMGGTTAKLCLIDNAKPRSSRSFEIARAARFIKGSGLPVRIPVIDMIEIGAGGGSIARRDRLGRLTVGPDSAGSEPGPVAFGKGGQNATVTDADAAMGYLLPDRFAEGQVTLDPDAALVSIQKQVGTNGAEGIAAVVDEAMASAARMHAAETGADLGNRAMIAFGGNGPVHAARVARAAGVHKIYIPRDPSVGSALGFLHAPVSFETIKSRYTLLAKADTDELSNLLMEMAREAEAIVRQGAPQSPLETWRSAFMRYHGQGHEIEIPVPEILNDASLAQLKTSFEAAYAKQFSRPIPGMDIEILNWAVRVTTPSEVLPERTDQPASLSIDVGEHRAITCDRTGALLQATCIARADLQPGATLTGPALIHEPQTTTYVPADFTLFCDADGTLVLSRKFPT